MKKLFLILAFMFAAPLAQAWGSYYGAIAIDTKTGEVGWSYDYGSRAAAENRALNGCKGKCEIAVWFADTCAAVAYSPSTQTYAWAWGNYYESNAVEECRKKAKDCKVAAWVCTSY